jgi:hypothetical protein
MEIDTSQFFRGLNQYSEEVQKTVKTQMDKNLLRLEQLSKDLAPLDEGTLSGSGAGKTAGMGPRKTRTKFKAGMYEATMGFNAPYAAIVHETMWPAVGVSLGRSGAMGVGMMPGELTAAKTGEGVTRFGPAGGKYLERPLLGMAPEFTKRIGKKLRRLRGLRGIRARR